MRDGSPSFRVSLPHRFPLSRARTARSAGICLNRGLIYSHSSAHVGIDIIRIVLRASSISNLTISTSPLSPVNCKSLASAMVVFYYHRTWWDSLRRFLGQCISRILSGVSVRRKFLPLEKPCRCFRPALRDFFFFSFAVLRCYTVVWKCILETRLRMCIHVRKGTTNVHVGCAVRRNSWYHKSRLRAMSSLYRGISGNVIHT